MSATFAILSAVFITIVVCATTCALFLTSAQTHRVWAARWARVRAARAQTRAQVQASRARAAWRDAMIKG